MLTSSNYNPDVLNCLANLSSDEVFTPPKLGSFAAIGTAETVHAANRGEKITVIFFAR